MIPSNNVYDAKEQVAEMVRYCQLKKQTGDQAPNDALCRQWIRKYAALWRDLKKQGVDNPVDTLQAQYLTESQYKWPTRKIERVKIQRHNRFRTLAEKLALI